jgi:hypothetical protein
MNTRIASVALTVLLGIPASEAYAERPSQIDTTRTDAVELSHRFSRGASLPWTVTLRQRVEGLQHTRQQEAEVELTARIRNEVQSVDATGIATLATSIADPSVQLRINGSAHNAAPTTSVLRSTRMSQRIRPDGTTDERTQLPARDPSGADTSAALTDLLSYMWIQFPAEPLRVGDSWVQSIPTYYHDPQNGVNANATIRYRFAGYALHQGTEHLVLETIYEVAVDGTRTSSGSAAQTARIVGRGHGSGYALIHAARGSVSELGVELGYVLTVTEQNGRRATEAITTTGTVVRSDG